MGGRAIVPNRAMAFAIGRERGGENNWALKIISRKRKRGGGERERAACVRGWATRRKEGRMKEGMEMLKVRLWELHH